MQQRKHAVTPRCSAGFGDRVRGYHAKLSLGQRRDSHSAFLRDDAEVMVATVAYGM